MLTVRVSNQLLRQGQDPNRERANIRRIINELEYDRAKKRTPLKLKALIVIRNDQGLRRARLSGPVEGAGPSASSLTPVDVDDTSGYCSTFTDDSLRGEGASCPT